MSATRIPDLVWYVKLGWGKKKKKNVRVYVDAGTDVLKLFHFESSKNPVKLTRFKAFGYYACKSETGPCEKKTMQRF
jgi:hypothetical protein